MNLYLLICLPLVLHTACDEVCKSTGQSTTNRLIDHLLCNYGNDKMYQLYTEKITFNVRLLPQYVEVEKQTNSLEFCTWFNISWSDTNLVWEPIRWNGIRWINVNSSNLRMPEVNLFYRGDATDFTTILSLKNCLLTYDGSVHCVTPATYTLHCPIDYNEWPYDKHNCSLYIALQVQYTITMLNFGDIAINMTEFRPNKRWNVFIAANYLWTEGNSKYMNKRWLALSVLLERRRSELAIMYILPIVVFMTLTLIVLWLDSQSLERIFVASINLIFHILGLCNLHKHLPTKRSLNTPQILLFYEASIGIAAYALIFTCFLRKLKSLKVSAPTWLVSGTTLIINSPVTPYLGIVTNRRRQIDVIHESNDNGCPNRSTWQEFATILEWIHFVVVFVTYSTMLGIVLAPKEPREI